MGWWQRCKIQGLAVVSHNGSEPGEWSTLGKTNPSCFGVGHCMKGASVQPAVTLRKRIFAHRFAVYYDGLNMMNDKPMDFNVP